MKKEKRFSPEIRERAVRLVLDQQNQYPSQWAAIAQIAPKFGCSKETLCSWIRRREKAKSAGSQSAVSDKELLKQLQRENKELKQANEILRKVSAFFAQAELDRKPK